MKKIIMATIAGSIFVSNLMVGGQAEAKSQIKYTNPVTVKKAKAGTLSMDGIKIGTKIKKYSNDLLDYRKIMIPEYTFVKDNDVMFADFQAGKSTSSLYVTRIVDKNVDEKFSITRNQMLKLYKKPLMSDEMINPEAYGTSRRVDVYKNITFFYEWTTVSGKEPRLAGAVIFHNKDKKSVEKWFQYATGQAGFSSDDMEDYISSSEWASL